MFLARAPKRSVLSVSCALNDEGEQHTTSAVRALPPSDSWSTRVSLESVKEGEREWEEREREGGETDAESREREKGVSWNGVGARDRGKRKS